MRRVVVTGLGLVTPAGRGAGRAWEGVLGAAKGARAAVRSLEEDFAWAAALPCRIAARVADDGAREQGAAAGALGFGSSGDVPRFIRFAVEAADEALGDARWSPRGSAAMEERTGVSIANSIGSIEDVFEAGAMAARAAGAADGEPERARRSAAALRKKISPFFVPRILVNMASGAVSIKHGLRGPGVSSSTACAAGAHAIIEAARVLRCGEADVMVAGGSESCVNLVAMAGFCKARALSTSFNDAPAEASRPFDARRDGFVMAEGAAVRRPRGSRRSRQCPQPPDGAGLTRCR